MLEGREAEAQPASNRTVVFSNTTVVNLDAVQNNVALAVQGDRIAAIGPTDQILKAYPQADVYDGRGKALVPGLINCHAHLGQTLARGFNEDFGFPNNYRLAVQPTSLLSREEATLMAVVGALEAIRTGSTTVVENVSGTGRTAAALAETGLRWVFAESATDREGAGRRCPRRCSRRARRPGSRRRCATRGYSASTSCSPRGTARRVGASACSRPPGWPRTRRPSCLPLCAPSPRSTTSGTRSICPRAAPRSAYMRRHHGVSPVGFLARHNFLGPRLFAAHCRYVDEADIALLGKSGTIVSHQAGMAANRGVIPPIPALRAAGCPIANGTDNNTTDMFEVMRIALLTERIRRDDEFPGVQPQPEDMLADATLGGARAVRQEKTIGSLEVGKKADLLVLDTQRVHIVPAVRIAVGVDSQRAALRHRVRDGGRPVRHAGPQDPHGGRGAHHRRSRQGRTAGLDGGAKGQPDTVPRLTRPR